MGAPGIDWSPPACASCGDGLAAWFWDTLVDADLANNTFGWQCTAGCGADAAPYFRIFNPTLQATRYAADGRHIRRWVPLLTPWLSSLWLGLVTPLFARVGRKLIASITLPSVVGEPRALDLFDIRPVGYREAIARARAGRRGPTMHRHPLVGYVVGVHRRWGGVRFGNRLVDSRGRFVPVSARRAFAPIQRIGGGQGGRRRGLLVERHQPVVSRR